METTTATTTHCNRSFCSDSKCRQTQQQARLAGSEARIAADHQRYLDLMAHMSKGR